MTKGLNIRNGVRVLIILLSVVFMLSACSSHSTRALTYEQAVDGNGQVAGTCWQKDILVPIYDVIGQTVMRMFNQLSQGAMALMMICFAIWVAIRLMKFVSSVAEDSPGEIWNEIVRKAFLCLLCGFLASSATMLLVVTNTFLFPIYEAFLEFGSRILQMADQTVTSVTVMGSTIEFTNQPSLLCTLTGNATASLAGFPDNIREMMGCMVCAVSDRIRLGSDISLIVMSTGGMMPFFIGLLMWLTFIVVGCGFVFYLVDSIFRFGLMILLLPIFIMAYAFGPTRKWTGIGFANIMNSAAFMMAFSIIVATSLMALIHMINDNPNVFDPDNPQLHFSDFSIAMMCLLLVAFLIFGSMQVSQQLTSAIIGGKVDAKFQQNLKAVGQAVLGIITGGFGWALKKSGFFENTKVGRAIKQGGALQHKLKELAGRKK